MREHGHCRLGKYALSREEGLDQPQQNFGRGRELTGAPQR